MKLRPPYLPLLLLRRGRGRWRVGVHWLILRRDGERQRKRLFDVSLVLQQLAQATGEERNGGEVRQYRSTSQSKQLTEASLTQASKQELGGR